MAYRHGPLIVRGSRLIANEAGFVSIYVMNSDGSGLTKISSGSVQDAGPVWSPDGARIAFVRNDGNIDNIYIMNSDGSGQTMLTSGMGPAW